MTKDFKKKNPLENLSKSNMQKELGTKDKKKKVGRPRTKTEPTKTINIAVPVSLLEKTDVAKACFNNNLTFYINKLIEKDIEENFETYKTIYERVKDLMN